MPSLIHPCRLEIYPDNLRSSIQGSPYGVVPMALLFWAEWLDQPQPLIYPIDLGLGRKIVRCEQLPGKQRFRLVVVYQNDLANEEAAIEITVDFSSETDLSRRNVKKRVEEALAHQRQLPGYVAPGFPEVDYGTNSAEDEPSDQR